MKVNSEEQMCYFLSHSDFDDRLLYCVVRYARVKQEGEPGGFFDALPASEETVVDAVVVHEGEEEEQPRLSSDVVEDIARL